MICKKTTSKISDHGGEGRKGYSPTSFCVWDEFYWGSDDVDYVRILLLESNKAAEQWPHME